MDEYISREELRKHLKECYDNELFDADMKKAVIGIDIYVENMPSADVQPVKHGRWETWGYVFHGIAWKRCSECGKTADVSYQALLDGKIEMATPSICGCCSARMDGDSDA